MFRKQSRIISIVLALLCVAAPVQSAQNDHILKNIPADILFCLRIKNLEYTANMVDQFLVGVSPIPLATSMLVRTQFAQILGNPELRGLNMAGNFVIFATVAPNQKIPDLYSLLPITDYSLITDANTNVPKPDVNGISTIMLNGKPFGCLIKLGNYALQTKDYAKTLNMAKLLSAPDTPKLFSALDSAELKKADEDLIWIYGNIKNASDNYGQALFDTLEQLKKTMKTAASQNSPDSPMDPSFMIDGYIQLLKTLLAEGDSLTIATTPKPSLLMINAAFKARTGTDTAAILTADSAPQSKRNLAGYLNDGAVMNFVMRTNHSSMKKMYDLTTDLVSNMAGRDPNAADAAKIKKLSSQLIDSIGGLCVCSFSADPNNKPPFNAKYFLEVKDGDQFCSAAEEFANLWNGSAYDDFYKKMGMNTSFTVERGVDNYKGVQIDSARFDMNWGDSNSPQVQMVNNMYGEGMNYRWAIVNGLWVCQISNDSKDIYKLIDQAKSTPPATLCTEIQKAKALIPDADNQDFIFTYNYLRLFKMMRGITPMPLPTVDVPTKNNLVFAGKVSDGTFALNVAIPKEHLVEIMTMFRMMQQQIQQQMIATPPGGSQ